jgi:hypothetical protein
MPFTIQEKSDGLIFKIRVQPRSSRNQVAGSYGDALKINLTAPPVDNAANKACAVFLADLLSVAKSSIDAGWSSLVARRAHNPKVRGSNPLPATNKIKRLWYEFFGESNYNNG